MVYINLEKKRKKKRKEKKEKTYYTQFFYIVDRPLRLTSTHFNMHEHGCDNIHDSAQFQIKVLVRFACGWPRLY